MSRPALSFLLTVFIASSAAAQTAAPGGTASGEVSPEQPAQPAAKPAPEEGATWTDATSALVWQREAADRGMDWKEAADYCQANRPGLPGAGWRLPSVDELKTLLASKGEGGCRWPAGLSGACDIYWSSSEASAKSDARYVDFTYGLVDSDDRGYEYHARCVRKR